MTVNSYYKPPNQPFDFRSSTTDTPLQVIIGDCNSHIQEWGYISTNDDVTLVERWYDANRLTLIHNAKLPKSFNRARWKQGYNAHLSFVYTSINHQCEKLVLEVIPKSQHRPIANQDKSCNLTTGSSSQKKVQPKETEWVGFAKSIAMGITEIVPTPNNYGCFVDIFKESIKTEHSPRMPHKLYLWSIWWTQRVIRGP